MPFGLKERPSFRPFNSSNPFAKPVQMTVDAPSGASLFLGPKNSHQNLGANTSGANTIISLRGCELSGRFEDYWESRRAQA
jgi:hypothetical protein